MTAKTPKEQVNALWQRFRDPGQQFSRAHTESLFALARELLERIDQFEAPVREAMALAGGDEGVDVHAFARVLMTKCERQRKRIAALEPESDKLKQLLETTLDGEQGIHISTGGKPRTAKLFSAQDVEAFTAVGFALRKKREDERAAQLAADRPDAAAIAAVPDLKNNCALVLYFPTDADRDEFVALIHEAKPGMRTVKL